jgi:hypothetical protein
MKVEQHINARLFNRANMPENFARFRIVQLRFKLNIKSLDTVGNRPLKNRAVLLTASANRNTRQQLDKAPFISGFNHDNWHFRSKHKVEVVRLTHGLSIGLSLSMARSKLRTAYVKQYKPWTRHKP